MTDPVEQKEQCESCSFDNHHECDDGHCCCEVISLAGEVERLTEALRKMDGDCAYEIESRRCCAGYYDIPESDWCGFCVAHAALSPLPSERKGP